MKKTTPLMTRKSQRRRFGSSDLQFNMTAMIDVVLLLIIFFMLICQFITRENFMLNLPDNVTAALAPQRNNPTVVTVSVFYAPVPKIASPGGNQADSKNVLYAVRAKSFDPLSAAYLQNANQLTDDLAAAIALETRQKPQSLIHLRADKDLTYEDVQPALLALAKAGVTTLRFAATSETVKNQPAILTKTK